MTLDEIRQKYPQYNDLSDMQLAKALHSTHYSDLPLGTFMRRAGFLDSKPVDPTEGMSGLEKFGAGYGKAAVDLGRGVGQALGLVSRQDVADSRALDAPLMNTGAGKAGYIGGMVADLLPTAAIPGANTIAGAGAIGAGTGFLMPSASTKETLANTAIGGAVGAGTQAAVQGIGAGYRGLKSMLTPASEDATPAAETLLQAGVPVDRSQLTGNRVWQSLRGMVADHPATSKAQSEFVQGQQQAFNNAVLKRIGESGSEASQEVMNAARTRIGSVFDSIGKNGTAVDDQLLNEIATISDNAARTTPQSALHPLFKNVDDIVSAADKDGNISGEALRKIRSNLSALSKNADVGQAASELEDSLLGALGRSNPGDAEKLQQAVTQWRSLRTIQQAVGPGMERNISPLKLSNAIASKPNQNMSVYGLGGDQELVKLAQAGRILPEQLPNSGTAGRSLMNAPIRQLATAPYAKLAQWLLLKQPGLAAGAGVTARGAAALPPSMLQELLRNSLPASTVSGTYAASQ